MEYAFTNLTIGQESSLQHNYRRIGENFSTISSGIPTPDMRLRWLGRPSQA